MLLCVPTQSINNKAQQDSLGGGEIHLSRKTFISELMILGLTPAEIKDLGLGCKLPRRGVYRRALLLKHLGELAKLGDIQIRRGAEIHAVVRPRNEIVALDRPDLR